MAIPAFEPGRGHGTDAVSPLLDLDDPRCADPSVAGGKAALLCRARAAGLPALGGIVVTAPVSRPYMRQGRETLESRGSGGARLEVSMSRLDDDLAEELVARSRPLGEVVVVRSSSVLESASRWSGAFTSYLDMAPAEVAKAVTGCWASAFTVSALERYEAAGIAPGSAEMAVLIQPALDPDFGGTARLENGEVVVTAIAGSPAPLVQGWEPGVQARVAPDGRPRGGAALDLVGEELLGEVAALLRAAGDLDAGGCEWAATHGKVFLLQLLARDPAPPATSSLPVPDLSGIAARDLGRLVRRYPGPLGEALVLPWALGDPQGLLADVDRLDLDPSRALVEATEHASRLTAQVWSRPRTEAARAASRTLSALRGPEPHSAWREIASLQAPDPEQARLVLGCLAAVRHALVVRGAVTWPELGWHLEPRRIRRILSGGSVTKRQRIGFDRWEPFNAAVVAAEGRLARGVASAPGVGCGRMCWISRQRDMERFRPRDVVVAPHPTPDLAALLWDAAGVVTTGGSPAAHLFESARALAIPAVSGVHLDEVVGGNPAESQDLAMAVDGSAGTLFVTEW